jgi:hypothetical protein
MKFAWKIAGMRKKIKVCRISVGKPERESSLEDYGFRMKVNGSQGNIRVIWT